MNLRDLEYLVALADHGTFGRAAEACGVSQPTLSVQIKKLEAELDTVLLQRDGRSTSFTPVGQRVLGYAREVILGVANIHAATTDARRAIKVGVFPTLAQYFIPHVSLGLRGDMPETDVHWVERKSGKLETMLVSGALDAAVLAAPVPSHSGLVSRELFTEHFMLAAPEGHALAGDAPLSLNDISAETLILLDDGHCFRDQVLQVCGESGAAEDGAVRAHSLETLRHMVSAGVGVTLLPHLAVVPPAPVAPGVVVRSFSGQPPHRDIHLVWRSSSPYGEVLEALCDSMSMHVAPALCS